MEPGHQWKVTAIISGPAQACGSQDQRGKAMSAILYPGNNCKYQTETASKDQCMDMSDSCLQVKRHNGGAEGGITTVKTGFEQYLPTTSQKPNLLCFPGN